jgi:hypothetical protein
LKRDEDTKIIFEIFVLLLLGVSLSSFGLLFLQNVNINDIHGLSSGAFSYTRERDWRAQLLKRTRARTFDTCEARSRTVVSCCSPNYSGRTPASTRVGVVVAWMVLETFLAHLFLLALFSSFPYFRRRRNRSLFSVRHLGDVRDR